MLTQRPRRDLVKLALLCVLLLSLALAAGCATNSKGQPSSDTDGAAPATSSADSPETASTISEEEAREVAEKVLLTLRDFPAGWSQLPPDEDDEDPELDLPEECRAIYEQDIPPGALVDIDSPEFEGPDEEEVDSGATVYVDAEAAHQTYVDGRDWFDRCREPLVEAFRKYLQQVALETAQERGVENVEIVAVSWDWLPSPPYGDESVAMRMSYTLNVGAQSFVWYSDMFGWRVGRVEGGMSFTTKNEIPEPNEEERLMQIIDERLRKAAKDLD
jgi:hypothetical protein